MQLHVLYSETYYMYFFLSDIDQNFGSDGSNRSYMSRLMGKPTICICENNNADQLHCNREADQRLCFRYTDSTLPLLFKSEISSFQPASVTVQLRLCLTCSETSLLVFPRGGSYIGSPVAWNHSVAVLCPVPEYF